MQLGTERDPVEAQVEVFRRDARKERFSAFAEKPLCGNGFGSSWSSSPREPALGEPVVGTSTAIFRPFLRLRATPDPANVRPEKVLSTSLSCLLKEDSQPPGGWEAVREQLWSIRQDLLVQHLHRGRLAAELALEGARLSARAGDVAELHRSLATLVGSGHCAKRVRTWTPALRDEVAGLRLLYLTHGGLEGTPGRLEGELLEFFQEHYPTATSSSSRPGRCLDFARQIHRIRVSGNCARHLRLASQGLPAGASSDSCGRLAWTLATSVKKRGLEALAKAFPQGLRASRAAAMLGLQGEDDLEAWLASELPQSASTELISRGRLDAAAVAASFADQQRAAAPPRERMVVSSSKYDTDEAPIWSELRPAATSQLEVLKKMAANATSPGMSKALKKAAKKEKKQQKKRQKKEKKKTKKAKKKDKKEAKKRKQSSSSSASSSSDEAD